LDIVARDYTTETAFTALDMGWSKEKLANALPGYSGLIAPALAVLSSEGLIADQNSGQMNVFAGAGQYTLTDMGKTVLDRLHLGGFKPQTSVPATPAS